MEEEERADHVFPLLTSALWHVHTWFRLERCFSGIAVGASGWRFHLGTGRSVRTVSEGGGVGGGASEGGRE